MRSLQDLTGSPVVRIAIDLNVRVPGHRTYTGFEDVDGAAGRWPPVAVREHVTVFERECLLEGDAVVDEVDLDRRLVFLKVDWASMHDPAAETWKVG